jgi:hypothetical protein
VDEKAEELMRELLRGFFGESGFYGFFGQSTTGNRSIFFKRSLISVRNVRQPTPASRSGRASVSVQSEYSGYVAWRGVVQESDLSADVLKVFEDNFTFFRMAESPGS